MKFKKLTALLLSASMAVGLLADCGGTPSNTETGTLSTDDPGTEATGSAASGESSLKGKRVRAVVGPTSTDGDSYMVAGMVTRYLDEGMGFNGKVDAIGNAQALDTISKAKGDGTTIMMFHDMAFLSVLFDAAGEDCAPESLAVDPRIGANPGNCFVAKAGALYNNLDEVAQWLADNPGEELRASIESGSVSRLDFVAWYIWVQEQYGDKVASRIKALVDSTTDEKKQCLWDGNTGIVYADCSSYVKFTKEDVGAQPVMKLSDTCDNLEGSSIIPMADDGIIFNGKPFGSNKDFFILFPKDVDESILNEIVAAMQKVCEDLDFQTEMTGLLYSTATAEEADPEASRQSVSDERDIDQEIIDVALGLDELI